MEAGTLDLKTIFGQDRRHVVPLYQRPYVWEEKKQWEPLWDDIEAVARRLLADQPTRAHFLGAIVLEHHPKRTGCLETRLIIDGQQRLTTLQLVLEAFADFCRSIGEDRHHKALLKLTRNDDPMNQDPIEQFKVWPTTVDQDAFRMVMDSATPGEVMDRNRVDEYSEPVQHAIADAYLYFHGRIAAWIQEDASRQTERLDALLATLREQIRLVVIDLGKEDDAQLIFETLNARGTPLLPTDLVKNHLFHKAQQAGLPLDSLYETFWKPFDEKSSYWRKPMGRGQQARARIDTLLQHYLTIQARDEILVSHLYVAFRDHATAIDDPAKTLQAIARYAAAYRGAESLKATTRAGLFMQRLGDMDTTTLMPIVLELFVACDSQPGERDAALVDLESFLVRRMICRLTPKNYNRLAVDLVVSFAEGTGSPRDRLRKELLKSEADTLRWPSDEECTAALQSEPIYRTLTRKRLRMILRALELQLRTGKSEAIDLERNLTIEHLLPRQWQKHWPLPAGAAVDAEEQRNRLLHTIGNLTLLTKKLNPAVSNGPWEKKLAGIQRHSLLRLNSELSDHAAEAWDEDAIRRRGRALAALACKTWPRPAGRPLDFDQSN
ncbi:MAG: DUF262 domain-containing HNH endonuclease family protein [Planctomycetia bacterium]